MAAGHHAVLLDGDQIHPLEKNGAGRCQSNFELHSKLSAI
jgi:hypothetical protein